MPIFDNPQIDEIVKRAKVAQVFNQPRELLFTGIDPEYAAGLVRYPTPITQMEVEVRTMNVDAWLGGGQTPLAKWLNNVKSQLPGRPNDQKFFGEYYELAVAWAQKAEAADKAKMALPAANSAPPKIEATRDAPSTASLERFLFKNELLPVGFLLSAAKAAQAVCLVEVPLYRDAVPIMSGATPVLCRGSGWLIGKRHVITNHHVIAGQADGAPPPTGQDFALQGAGTRLKFGFDADSLGSDIAVMRMCHADARLDFAILELSAQPDADPLVLRKTDFRTLADPKTDRFPEEARFAVNIIQHPNGAPKQIAMRNNLAAGIEGINFSYFTDTDKGSSGSPVCDDKWQVVALHKAATRTQGRFDYQGKTTSWMNIGTPIIDIAAHLSGHADAAAQQLWVDVGAVMVNA